MSSADDESVVSSRRDGFSQAIFDANGSHPVRQNQNELLVLGNGPSLRDYDFSDFTGWKTLGMNAAYRYWNRIDWRPTFYCCLDDALIDTHKDAIKALIAEGRIERFFLTARILEHFPELISDRRIQYLDEFIGHWHRVRGKQLGLKYSPRPAFETRSPNLLTTGSYSIRFAAMLGFTEIRLLGIDLSYQSLKQARNIGGTRLVMDDTPTDNPNYFFSDYQQEGDQFNVANPDEHGRDLHLHAFIALRDDFVAHGVPSRVVNADARSKLFDEAILPFQPLDTSLSARKRKAGNSILLNVSTTEALDNLLWLWNQPAHFPALGTSNRRSVDLTIASQTPDMGRLEKRVKQLMRGYPAVRNCFREIRVCDHTPPGLGEFERQHVDGFARRVDEVTAPICCDWLTQWMCTEDGAVSFIDLPAMPQSSADVLQLRSAIPGALFMRSPNMQDTLTQLRQSGATTSLARLLSSPVPDRDNHDGKERRRIRRVSSFFSRRPRP